MRRFVILAHRVPVAGAFTLNDLAGGAGRMDEVARAVSTALTLSNDLRRDTELTILFSASPPPAARKIRIDGSRVRYLNPDERSTAALLKNALVRSVSTVQEIESSPGLYVGPVDPVPELERIAGTPHTVWLQERGEPLRSWRGDGRDLLAVVSDPYNPSLAEEEILSRNRATRVSVGPRSLRTSQVIDLVQNELDLREVAGSPTDSSP